MQGKDPVAYRFITESESWKALQAHHSKIKQIHLRNLFQQDPSRATKFSLGAAGIFLDYSKNPITDETIPLFAGLAQAVNFEQQRQALLEGKNVNSSEQRPALHTALRAAPNVAINVNGDNVVKEIASTQQQMAKLVDAIHTQQWRGYSNKPIRNIINIGIGGSYLGPKLVAEGLRPYWHDKINCHYLANIDGSDFVETTKNLSAEDSLFIVASKSFSTLETLKNAQAARRWFLANGGNEQNIHKHFIAVSSNTAEAEAFGIRKENIFPMWDWVGGRFSLWSAIGLPLALAIGMDNFKALLSGAQAMDQHFQTAPAMENMPLLMALLQIWQINFFGAQTQAIIPYDYYLRGLPAYLQQLEMESSGKSATRNGEFVDYATGAIIWGGAGTNGQHAYHQLIHQGTTTIPVDFILPMESHNPVDDHHDLLFANGLSQSRVMMLGKTLQQAEQELRSQGYSNTEISQLAPQKVIPGNRPNNVLLLQKVTPQSLGSLIALYEHKVFCQSIFWQINPFDQWGVELGKKISDEIYQAIVEPHETQGQYDASTQNLINKYRANR